MTLESVQYDRLVATNFHDSRFPESTLAGYAHYNDTPTLRLALYEIEEFRRSHFGDRIAPGFCSNDGEASPPTVLLGLRRATFTTDTQFTRFGCFDMNRCLRLELRSWRRVASDSRYCNTA